MIELSFNEWEKVCDYIDICAGMYKTSKYQAEAKEARKILAKFNKNIKFKVKRTGTK
jgi:hypothetical protein